LASARTIVVRVLALESKHLETVSALRVAFPLVVQIPSLFLLSRLLV